MARRHFIALCASLVLAAPVARAADAALIAAAKKEGEVVWYTTQILDPLVLRMQAAFAKKYGVEIKPVRANSTTRWPSSPRWTRPPPWARCW